MFRPAWIILHAVVAFFAAARSITRLPLPVHPAQALLIPLVLFASGVISTCSARAAMDCLEPGAPVTRIRVDADTPQQEKRSDAYSVLVSGNAVSVAANETAIDNILAEIGRQKHFKLCISPEFTSYTVTDRFGDIPLEKALERLMKGRSYSVVYGGATSPQSIQELHVLPSRSSQGQKHASIPPVPGDSREELLHALETASLPAGMKAALRYEAHGNAAATEQVLHNRTEVLQQLLRKLESSGAGTTDIAGQLRRRIGEGASE